MKKIKKFYSMMFLGILFVLSACSLPLESENVNETVAIEPGKIYLYGETHAVDRILEEELKLWDHYYHNEGMRHLFVEYGYFTAQFLNIWMQSEDDIIFEDLFRDLSGTDSGSDNVKDFYKNIKENYPETIFHGTDIGHQYFTTGRRYLTYLEEQGLEESEQYLLAQEAIDQGLNFYMNNDHVYRENMMAENFIREFDPLEEGESIMGIFGAAHTRFGDLDYVTQSVPNMASQLKEYYGDRIYTEDLSYLKNEHEIVRIDSIEINGKIYEASYYGRQNLYGFKDYQYRDFWRLENAYEDFREMPRTNNVLPYNNYPMIVEEGQVFVIDLMKYNNSVERVYYRSDGDIWQDMPSTVNFIISE